LTLYAGKQGRLDVDDVTAVVSDASALALEDIADTAFAGRPAELETLLAKARTAGTSAGSLLFNAQRQLALLHRWRIAIEDGAPLSVDAVQPPVHFRRKALVEAALKTWNVARLTAAMADLAVSVLESRRRPALADTIAERALLVVATQARRGAPAAFGG
ncbi:MAG: DNA polymerase III subunit delta, partial [Xanthobacteraceae bacterium]